MSITLKRANSHIEIDVTLIVSTTGANVLQTAAVFIDTNPDAIFTGAVTPGDANCFGVIKIHGEIQLSDTNQHTVSVRVGTQNSSYPLFLNGVNSFANLYGGSLASTIFVTEYV